MIIFCLTAILSDFIRHCKSIFIMKPQMIYEYVIIVNC
jgi:hypothetical protein